MEEKAIIDLERLLKAYDKAGWKHAFRLKEGDVYQGYIDRIEDGVLRMWDSGPLASEEILQVPIQEIDLTTLAYLADGQEGWIDFEAA